MIDSSVHFVCVNTILKNKAYIKIPHLPVELDITKQFIVTVLFDSHRSTA